MPTETALTMIAITLFSLAVITAATLYFLPQYLRPIEDDGHH